MSIRQPRIAVVIFILLLAPLGANAAPDEPAQPVPEGPVASPAQEQPPPSRPAAPPPPAPPPPLADPPPASTAVPDVGTGPDAAARECLQFADDAGVVADAVSTMTIAVGDSLQPLTELRLVGLRTLSQEQVWNLIGGRVHGELSVAEATALVARLAQTGLFSRVTTVVRLPSGERTGAQLEVTLVEHEHLQALEISGLVELSRAEILEALLVLPGQEVEQKLTVDRGRKHERWFHVRRRDRRTRTGGDRDRGALHCPPPVAPRDWVAHQRHGQFEPGLVWRGLPAGITRVQRLLEREGYLLARVTAKLTADGRLVLSIDEGRTDSVTIKGVHPSLRAQVAELLGVTPGGILNVRDLRRGLHSVNERYPFLDARGRRRPRRASLDLSAQVQVDGSVDYTFRQVAPRCDDDETNDDTWTVQLDDDELFTVDLDDDDDDDGEDCTTQWSAYDLAGNGLTVYFTARRAAVNMDIVELLRHTPVTGFAPGFRLGFHLWDPADRAHFRFDTLFNVNSGRESLTPIHDGVTGELAAAERIDLLVAPSVSIPRIGLTELGGAAYTLTDTDDGYRVTSLDSYLNSALFGHAERDYFRRTGVTAFATFHWFDALTVGTEYRFDRYGSLASLADPDTLLSDDTPAPTPPVTEGLFGSVLVRAEWSSLPTQPQDVDAIGRRRPSQGPITDFDLDRTRSSLRTNATVELADPALGGNFSYWRATSDSVLTIATGHEQTVSLRLRFGGGSDLPQQRQEGLGGWGTLRGYGFKELGGGEFSALSNLEYRFTVISLFVDAGAVWPDEGDVAGPRLGLGTALNLGDSGQLAFAWRTDAEAEATPEVRLLFGRAW